MKFKRFGIRWNEKLGRPECPYMTRWVITLFGYAVRLHYWTGSDDQRHYHDHPWWMLIILLRGEYEDISPLYEGRHDLDKDPRVVDRLKAPAIRLRKAEHKHTVRVGEKGALSLLITGKKIRNWGYWLPWRNKVMRTLRYFHRYGLHPCDD